LFLSHNSVIYCKYGCIMVIPTVGLFKFNLYIVIVTGNPGVFQGYPYPYPSKPVPATKGRGFDGSG